MPLNMPAADIVPVAVLELLHVPPVVVDVSVAVAPVHTDVDPLIADGVGFTVTILVTRHVPML